MNPIHDMRGLARRTVLRGGVAAAAACAWPAAFAARTSPSSWRLLVNDPPTAELSVAMVAARYTRWARALGTHFDGRQVLVDAIHDIPAFLNRALAADKPMLVFSPSVNQLSKLVRDHGYQPLVRHAEPFKAAFILGRDAPFHTLTQLPGRRLLMPDPHSAPAALARAELRRQGVREPFISHARFAESVPAQVEAGVADAGVVSATVARRWQAAGGRILGETQPVVNCSVLAAPHASHDLVARLTNWLLAMNDSPGGILAEIGVKEWVRAERRDYLALLDYTGE